MVAPESTTEFTEDSLDRATVDIGICSIEIAGGSLEPIGFRFAYEPGMAAGVQFGPGNGHAQFQRHVKPRYSRRSNAHLYAREIVDGITAALDELEDPIQPALTSGNFGGEMWDQAQLAEADNVSHIKA